MLLPAYSLSKIEIMIQRKHNLSIMQKECNCSLDLSFLSFKMGYTLRKYKGQLISSLADQETRIKCHQIRSIFQHSPSCGSHTFSVDVTVLGSHWPKESTADMTSHELFSSSSYSTLIL